MTALIEKRIQLSPAQAQRLSELANRYHLSEEQLIDQTMTLMLQPAFPIETLLDVQSVADIDLSFAREQAFKRLLVQNGLLASRPSTAAQVKINDVLAEIQGVPLSLTVIEERR